MVGKLVPFIAKINSVDNIHFLIEGCNMGRCQMIVMIMSHVTVASDLVEHMVFNPIDIFNIKNVGGI